MIQVGLLNETVTSNVNVVHATAGSDVCGQSRLGACRLRIQSVCLGMRWCQIFREYVFIMPQVGICGKQIEHACKQIGYVWDYKTGMPWDLPCVLTCWNMALSGNSVLVTVTLGQHLIFTHRMGML